MPYKLPTACRNRSCPTLTTNKNSYCDEHQQEIFTGYGRKPAEHRKLYGTAAWKKARLEALRMNPLCVRCLAEGRTEAATDVHHVLDVKDRPDLALTLSNLEPLCKSHHSRHTLANQDRTRYLS